MLMNELNEMTMELGMLITSMEFRNEMPYR